MKGPRRSIEYTAVFLCIPQPENKIETGFHGGVLAFGYRKKQTKNCTRRMPRQGAFVIMCGTGRYKTLCRKCVVNFNISTLHVGPDQPDPRPNPKPNPSIWGARGRQGQPRGSAACFGGVYPKKLRAAEKPASTNTTRILHKALGRPVPQIGRAARQGGAPAIF